MTDGVSHNREPGCWRVIGVFGQRTCPELAEHVHCRNCPVYAASGRELFNRPIPPEYREQWTTLLAQDAVEQTKAQAMASVLVFRLGEQWLALPTHLIQSVSRTLPVRRLPHRSSRILRGLVNIEGIIRLCASIHPLFEAVADETSGESDVADKSRLIMVEKEGENWVFPVDEVHGLYHYQPDEMKNSPVSASRTAEPLTMGTVPWRAGQIGLIDEDKLIEALKRSLL
ncbi:MAG: chemotaxis protein CheW [Candidatus Lernaella stagnicola]|nr:chemotaxis protein CheW [Candidatus Lernaella stagnicola]